MKQKKLTRAQKEALGTPKPSKSDYEMKVARQRQAQKTLDFAAHYSAVKVGGR